MDLTREEKAALLAVFRVLLHGPALHWRVTRNLKWEVPAWPDCIRAYEALIAKGVLCTEPGSHYVALTLAGRKLL